MINKCDVCKGEGHIEFNECERCRGVGELSDDCSKGHIHCADVEIEGATNVICIDCETNLGLKCEVYSRVVGYLRPVGQWNLGKRSEFKKRKPFSMEKGMKCLNSK